MTHESHEQPLFAIDSPSTKDVDDAISLTRDPTSSKWIATVAVANPANHFAIGSQEDLKAKDLGATVYFADHVHRSMLPRPVVEERVALAAGQKRSALIVSMAIDDNLSVTLEGLRFKTIRNVAHVPYSCLAERARDPTDPHSKALGELVALSQRLMSARRSRGALAFFDLKQLLFLDEEGHVHRAATKDAAIGQIVVQEFMILANAAVATWAMEQKIPFVFRNHAPSDAAPSATDLAREVSHWIEGGHQDVFSARERFDHVLGVAHYSAIAEGHYALNLPAYAHVTSPLRRYADLVNERQILAAVSDSPLPYTTDDIAMMVKSLNATLARRKEERQLGFKATVVRRAKSAMSSDSFEKLADHELRQALKLANQANDYPASLVKTVISRMHSNLLTDTVLDRLIQATPGSLPVDLVDAFCKYLSASPHKARHFINYGEQKGIFSSYNSESVQPVANVPEFIDKSTVIRTPDGKHLQATSCACRKQDAANQSAAKLIINHLGGKYTGSTLTTSGELAAAAANHKGHLQERCAKRGWPLPIYTTKASGPSHAPTFVTVATLQLGGLHYTATSAASPSRTAAEQSAAQGLLEKLPKPTPAPTNSVSSTPADNPIGALQELAQKSAQAPPAYTFREILGGRFSCTVTTELAIPGLFSATADSKAAAKKLAAAAALKAVAHLPAH